ncbi:MAG: ribonuclease R [Clostridia bacterium]|nr:ribonuclease R [Clostridia bacterium]
MDIKRLVIDEINSQNYVPLLPYELFECLSSHGIEEGDFWRAISTLESEYDIQFTKKGKIASAREMGYLKGEFSASSKGGFGFVMTEDGDFFIPPKFTNGAYHGDKVVIKRIDCFSKYYGKGNEAEIVAITEFGIKTLIGTLTIYLNGRRPVAYVTPDNERIHFKVKIPYKALGDATDGDKVACKVNLYPKDDNDFASGEILEVLGRADSLEGNYKAILHSNGISVSFPQAVLDEADAVSQEKIDISGRADLRDEIIFTIDSADAKDLDDAISLRVTENGYVLGVHIADVSHYVRQGSLLDKEAIERGTSIYFTDKVVPMLPKALSNGICSLNGGVDRLTLSAFVTLDKSGTILSCEIKESVINSKMRGVYAEFNDILEKGEGSEFYTKYRHVLDDFYQMMELYRILKQKSEQKGAMELESEEPKIILDSDGHPIEIIKRERGESERLIEQFMLTANEGVATYMYNAGIPCVYRVHEEPDKDKIDSFALFARNLGVDTSPLRAKNTITPMQLSKILESSKEKGHFSIVSSILLRSLMKAKYSSLQRSHFGLNTEYYCHFTSPIRRYPDLSVHRILKAFLHGEVSEKSIEKYERFANLSAELSSENEIKAVHAERDIEELYKCVYMADRIGEEYDAVICSVTSFGFFAKTDNLCEGLVSLDSLGSGFYYDKDNYTLSRGRTSYRLGMNVKIRVSDVDIALRQVNFELVREGKERKNETFDSGSEQPKGKEGTRSLEKALGKRRKHSRDKYQRKTHSKRRR